MQFMPDSSHQQRLFAESPDGCCLDQFEHLLSLWHTHYSSVAYDQSHVGHIAYLAIFSSSHYQRTLILDVMLCPCVATVVRGLDVTSGSQARLVMNILAVVLGVLMPSPARR